MEEATARVRLLRPVRRRAGARFHATFIRYDFLIRMFSTHCLALRVLIFVMRRLLACFKTCTSQISLHFREPTLMLVCVAKFDAPKKRKRRKVF